MTLEAWDGVAKCCNQEKGGRTGLQEEEEEEALCSKYSLHLLSSALRRVEKKNG